MGNLAKAIDDFDLVDGVNGGREATVDTEDLVVDDHAEGQKIEHIGEIVPDICVAVFAGALGIEAVGLRHTPRLMIPTDQMYTVRVSQFKTDKQGNGFNAK